MDLIAIAVIPGPLGIGFEWEDVAVRWDVACAAGISVLVPGTANARVLFENDKLEIGQPSLDFVGKEDAAGPTSNVNDTERRGRALWIVWDVGSGVGSVWK